MQNYDISVELSNFAWDKTLHAMKSKVRFSSSCVGVTLIITVVLFGIAAIYLVKDEMKVFYTLVGIYLILLIPSMFYAPREVEVADGFIKVKSYLKSHKISLGCVASVATFVPTMGARRIFGCSGFLGHWGVFSEGDVGRYVAYYGKSSDCFIVRMKNGDKYVIGCENPKSMVDYINSILI